MSTAGRPPESKPSGSRIPAGTLLGFAKDMAGYLPAHLGPALVGLAIIPVVTRLFDPSEYGTYSLAVATLAFVMTLHGWIPAAVIRFYPAAERDARLKEFCGNALGLTLLSLTVACLIGVVSLSAWGRALPPELSRLLWVALGLAALSPVFQLLLHFLMAQREAQRYSLYVIGRSAGGLGLALLLYTLLQMGIECLLWGAIGIVGLLVPFVWRRALGAITPLRLHIDPKVTSSMARYGVPLVIGNLAAWVLQLSDRYVLELTWGSREVGIYAVGYDIANRCTAFVVSLFIFASGPLEMRIWEQQGEGPTRTFLSQVARYYLIVTVLAVAGLVALNQPLMRVAAGEEFFPGYRLFYFVAPTALLVGLQKIFQAGLLLHKKTVLITAAAAAGAGSNLLLNLLLIPRYGAVAAAATTLVSYLIVTVLVVVLSRRFLVWKFPVATSIRALLAAAVTALAIWAGGKWLLGSDLLRLLVCPLAGIMLYMGILLLLGEFEPREKEVVRSWVRRARARVRSREE